MKGTFALLGTVASVLWLGCLSFTPHPPQLLMTVCALGVLKLQRHQVVGGACLAGLVCDLFDWQVRLGFHAAVFGLVAGLLSPLKESMDTDKLPSLLLSAYLFAVLAACLSPLAGRLFGCFQPLPPGWLYHHLFLEPLYQMALILWLAPLRTMRPRASQSGWREEPEWSWLALAGKSSCQPSPPKGRGFLE